MILADQSQRVLSLTVTAYDTNYDYDIYRRRTTLIDQRPSIEIKVSSGSLSI